LKIPIIAVAKGPQRKKADLFFFKKNAKIKLLKGKIVQIRDEAHRFTIQYHRKLRAQEFLP